MHDWKSLVRARLGTISPDAARDVDIVEELAQHVAQHHADLTAAGTADADALERALAPLSDPRRIAREIARADRPRASAPSPPPPSRSFSAGIWQDIRYAARLLWRSPGFSAVAIVTLALGIAANTTIFSVLHAVLLRPLPYADADRLVYVGNADGDGRPGNTGFTTFIDWRAANRSFEEMAVIRSWTVTLSTGGEPERLAGMRVSSNFFRMLGVQPALGRHFNEDEDTPARWRVVLISDSLWRRRFNADPAIVGRAIRLSEQDFHIAGVMPAAFEPLISEHFYQRADIWGLVGYDVSQSQACRSCQHLKALARLKPDTSIAASIRDMNAIHEELRRRFSTDYPRASTIAVRPLSDELTGNIRPALNALMAAVAFVLLIACANVANLLLARVARQSHDLALRAAIGASRRRILQQTLVESGMLALCGSVLGIAASAAAIPILIRTTPVAIPRLTTAAVDSSVVLFAAGLAAATTLAFGLLPAMRASRLNISGAIGGDTRRTSSAPGSRARRLLVAVDVALAVVLLAGAGLMIRSVARLVGVHPGFDPDRVLTLQISVGGRRFPDTAAVVRGANEIVAKIQQVEGVTQAALATQIPLGGNFDTWGFHVVGRPAGPDDPEVERYSVTPQYFAAMRIPLIRGRLIAEDDRLASGLVMVVGQRTAQRIWPNEDPIGQHVRIGGYDGPVYTVVGVVGDVRHRELAAPPTLQMYVAQQQVGDGFLMVVARTAGDPVRLTSEIRRAIWSVAPEMAIDQVATLNTLVDKSVAPRRFVMLLLELFGTMALLMTAVGVYGVVAYSVSERTREFGVRAALGASRVDLARLVLRSGSLVVVAGLAGGCLLALGATRYLESSLFGIESSDPLTFGTVVLVLFFVTVVAQALPVLRATRVDPAVALRET